MYRTIAQWTPGTENVEAQGYRWSVQGEDGEDKLLAADIGERASDDDDVMIEYGDKVKFSVWSKNRWSDSDELTASGTAPTPDPEGPSGLSLTFEEIQSPASRARR